MANSHPELLEIILRQVAGAPSRPWYPGPFAQETGTPRDQVEANLDELRLAGLLDLTPWVKDRGQGYLLTSRGAKVLQEPRLLGRLRQGNLPQFKEPAEPPSQERHALDNVRGEWVRKALIEDSRPLVTQGLVVMNILWFLVGLLVYVFRYGGDAGNYVALSPFGGQQGDLSLSLTYIDIGSLFAPQVVSSHQWWRLISYGFVHFGVIHLGFNMYWLWSAGPMLERMWGRSVFLAIYLVSCAGGGALSLVLSPNSNMLGASGALCGLLGSMAAWLYLNRHFLPPEIVFIWRQGIVKNIVMIALISLLPGISWQGHLGGGLAGLVVSAPLNLARFGKGSRRGLGWAGAAAMVAIAACLTYGEASKDANLPSDARGIAEVEKALQKDLGPLFKGEELAMEGLKKAREVIHWVNLPGDDKVKDAREKLLALKSGLQQNAQAVRKLGPFRQSNLAATVKAGVVAIEACADLCGTTASALEAERPWPPSNLQALADEYNRANGLHSAFGKEWQELQQFRQGK